METLYVSTVTPTVAAVWYHTPTGRLALARDEAGHPLVAPDVAAAQALARGPAALVSLAPQERMLLRTLLESPARVHVSPVPGARAPQAFAWYGPDDSPTPQVLRHHGRLAVWNGASTEDACHRALTALQARYPEAVISPCPDAVRVLPRVAPVEPRTPVSDHG